MTFTEVEQFRQKLLAAASAVDVVQPPQLRPALRLWFLAIEERARIEAWRSLLGRSVVAVEQAATAVLSERQRRGET